MLLRDAVNPSEILLSEDAGDGAQNPPVQILRTGKFKHPKYGKFEITRATLSEMKSNFDKRVRGQDVAFDYFHKSDEEAAGWPKKLELREGGSQLWATEVEWTPRARKKLAEKEIRYFSPDFGFQWENPESGEVHRNVLFGGGLVNRPHIKNMAPIELSENEEDSMTELEKALADNIKLNEKVVHAETESEKVAKENADLKAENAKLKTENEAALIEKQKAEEAKKLAERETEFNVMLSEGKAVAAQKDAWMAQDMAAFVKNQGKINLVGSGSGKGNADSSEGDVQDKILKLAEAKMKEDTKMQLGEAIQKVMAENTDLRDAYSAR